MWQIENRTPFAAAQSWVRNLDGAETWLVVVKATFDVLPDGSTAVSDTQPAVTRRPLYRGEPGRSSVLYDNDFVLTKRTTDVVVNGTAYAPGGAAVSSIDVGVRVGPVVKVIRVFGERHWNGSALSAAEPFVQMPITYERAFGGADAESAHHDKDWYWPNPVGTGFVASRNRIGNTRPPNLEYPTQLITSWDSRPAPAALGVVASHWRDRAIRAGTYDDNWSATRQPLPPADFDTRYFQSVPEDQQSPTFLRGGEAVALANLVPAGWLRFTLPSVDLMLETRFFDGERRGHEVQLHTVILEPDFPRVSLIWHSAVECHAKVYELEHTRIDYAPSGVQDDDEDVDNLLDLV